MGSITNIAEFFLLSIALGIGLFSFLANSKETGAGLLKLLASIGSVSVGLAFALQLSHGLVLNPSTGIYTIVFLSFLLTYLFHKDEKTIGMKVLYIAYSIGLIALLYLFNQGEIIPFLFCLTSALLLGVVTYLMVMGHWYLVTPRLSEKPLAIGIKFCWAFLLVKIIWSTYNSFENAHYFASGTMEGGGYSWNWMMLLMRYLWGYVVIAVMSYYTWRLILIRSTQSATGVLYAMTFFVFVGELISIYLHFTYRLYI